MRRYLAGLLILLGLVSSTQAQSPAINVPATMASAPISIATATTTLLITGISGKFMYVTAIDVVAAGTGNIQFITGTGATCGTSTVNVTGNYNLTAQAGFAKGSGFGALWVLPSGNSLCAVTTAAVGMYGSVSYAWL
jgi:hypothetical protein